MATLTGLVSLLGHFGDYTIDRSKTESTQSLTLRGPIHVALSPE